MKQFSLLALSIFLLVGCSANVENQPISKIYNEQFKHADSSMPIPKDEKLANFTDFFRAEDSHWDAGETYPSQYICLNGEKSIKAEISSYQNPSKLNDVCTDCNTNISRTAVICGNKYIIQEFTPQLGVTLYGPYDTKTSPSTQAFRPSF